MTRIRNVKLQVLLCLESSEPRMRSADHPEADHRGGVDLAERRDRHPPALLVAPCVIYRYFGFYDTLGEEEQGFDKVFGKQEKDVRIENVCKDIIKVCNNVERQPRSPLNKCLRCLGNNALLITPIFIESDTGTFFCNLHGKSVLNPRCKSSPQRIYCSRLHVSSGCPQCDAQQIWQRNKDKCWWLWGEILHASCGRRKSSQTVQPSSEPI